MKRGYVATALSFGADTPIEAVRDLSWADLCALLNDHIRWRSVRGQGRTEAAIQFRQWSNPQIARLKREKNKRLRDLSNCPACGSDVHIGCFKTDPPHLGARRCSVHGCIVVDGRWRFECGTCGMQVDELFGLFIPYLCKACEGKISENQRKAGKVCGLCRQPYVRCCC